MDALQDLLSDLKSPDPSIRFSVLTKLEDILLSPQQLMIIQELLAQETDHGIRFHMQKLLARADTPTKTRSSIENLEKLLQAPGENEITLALMLESVKKTDAPLVSMALSDANWPEFSPRLLPSVLKFLKKYGSFEETAKVEKLCRHHDPRVLSAAVEALEKLSPDRLKDLIVPLLINPNYGIRSRAVRLLHKWDPSEAIRHFDSMLFSVHNHEKHAALFQAFFFPFKEIATLLLRYISVESDFDMIKKAGLLFRANPDRQIPAALLEIRQTSTGEKRNIIEDILKGVLQSLYQAGIVNAAPEKMLEILEAHFREKRLKLLLERYDIALKSGEDQVRFQTAIKLCELSRHNITQARTMLGNFLAREKNEKLKQKVEHYLHFDSQKEKQPVRKKFADLSASERQLHITSIDDKNKFDHSIGEILSSVKNLSDDEICSIIKLIEKFGGPEHSEILVSFLKTDSEEILSSAIDCLSTINPDILHPYLPQLIKHRFDEVKISAIKVFAMFDKGQAIALLEQMMASIRPVQRRSAIFCLAHFDFSSVGPTIFRALKNETDSDNRRQIASIIKSNADQETFYKIYCDSKTCRSDQTDLYQELCQHIANTLCSSDTGTVSAVLFSQAEEKFAQEQQAQKQRARYKLEKIQKIRKNTENNTVFDPSLIRFTIAAYLTGAVLTALVWFLFLAPAPESGNQQVKPRTQKTENRPVTISGKVVTINRDLQQIELLGNDTKSYRIKLKTVKFDYPEVDAQFQAQIKILSENANIVEAELISAF